MTQATAHDTLPPDDTPLPALAVTSYGLTDRGRVRASNEDNFLTAELARTMWVHQTSLPQRHVRHARNRGHIFLVADGMGGHEAGEVASALTVASIEEFALHILRRFSNLKATDEQGMLKDFRSALQEANARIFEETALHPQLSGMGTTLTLAFVSNWKLFVVHAGDSRCYLFRGGKLRQLTADHTWVGELLRHGLLNPEQAAEHPYRHVVTNVLGGTEAAVQADVQHIDLERGDVILLCSDGLTDMLDDGKIAGILQEQSIPQAACERLVAAANEQGGKDNVTAIVARFDAC
jgi:protein phosphatase